MIILASESPRRAELLARITTDFGIVPSDVDEHTNLDDPRTIVYELAKRKAEHVAREYPDDIVIGADTVVYVDGEVLGKPKDRKDVERMMRTLSGKAHEVWTGICMIRGKTDLHEESGSIVTFVELSEEEIHHYAEHEDVLDKAGAYAVQEGASKFVERIDGSCTGVMGLPVAVVYRMLKRIRQDIRHEEHHS